MYPTLFTIGKVTIPTYTVLLDIGLILGLILTYFEGKRLLGSAETALDLGLWTVIGGIVGGRVGYVVANLRTFSANWVQVVQIWKGGLSFHGAFLGGLLVLGIFALLQRRSEKPASFWQLADVIVPGLALGLIFGWAACLLGGSAYGATGRGFGYLVMPGQYVEEAWASRFATQIFGLVGAGVLFFLFWFLRERWPFHGVAFLTYCLLYFGGHFFLESTRGDEAIYLGPFRAAQVVDLAIALLAAVGLLVLWWMSRRWPEELTKPEVVDELQGPEGPKEVESLEGSAEPEEPQMPEEPEEPQVFEGPEAAEVPAAPKPTEAPAAPEPTEAPAAPELTEVPAALEPTEVPVTPEATEAPAAPEPTEVPAVPEPTEVPVTPEPTQELTEAGSETPESEVQAPEQR